MTSELKDAKDELDAFKSYFDNQIIKESNINPSRYHKHLTELHVTITKALEKQFKADKTTIDSLYTSNPALLPPKADIETKLKESHDNQLKEFEKKMEEDKKQLLEATNRESHRISFLAYVYKHNPAMKDTFDTLAQNAANNRTAGSGTNPVLSAAIVGGLKISFKGIDPKDLPDFKAFGATIASVKDDKGKITGYTMELPWRIWPGNIVGLEDKTKHRIVMLKGGRIC